ncbi:MAG: hypothetical protein A2044_08540 [Candidatus Firestonebacteria bacterium GWA2_43_8]|nr:MAG: hypothetical protein A2044_08540 [Candidatus Firestonebacteria bacterium GWA2_43_8]
MKIFLFLFVIFSVFFSPAAYCEAEVYPYRWVFVISRLDTKKEFDRVSDIVKTASEHGVNGVVLSANFRNLDQPESEYVKNLLKLKEFCVQNRMELIPQIFSAGYGGYVLSINKNLAEGIPVKGVVYEVRDGMARLETDPSVGFKNGGFEEYTENKAKYYSFHDQPGTVSFIDDTEFMEGKVSMRFENFTANPHGHGRVMQEIKLKPFRSYSVSCQVKTSGLKPKNCFNISALSSEGKPLGSCKINIKETAGWQKISFGFNSRNEELARIYAGVWEAKEGKFWVDNLRIEETGLLNILRRPGAPVTVKSEQTGRIYEEGKDYRQIADKVLDFKINRKPLEIKISKESRIADGERLLVDYFQGISVNDGQVSICMSEPEVYEIWKKQAEGIHKLLAPDKYLLSMDEIRAGGSCQACKDRKLSMAEILGDCITKQYKMIKQLNPEAEIFIWSDMLDPNHNAVNNYYMVDGDYSGSWKYIPKDMRIMCWYYDKRKESLKFFSGEGFKTAAGAYYDGDDLKNPKGWLDELDKTKGALGIMYTTWKNKYDLLADFGELTFKRK